ncbi:tetratricopeptide repeat protein [uncultured Pseudodesulfovibrio sp.]|uniref:SPOR domain-containing protein n=1 Tax=uncultured Pseudodesulfovibrio sp. TaxID=2035858 RepID=UPI0029C9461F|nr:tetratricopeptide repeat protein [uncultured Pseudodesulfovibrio sp.]
MRKFLIITVTLIAGIVLSGCMAKSYDDKTFDQLAYGKKSPVTLTSEQHEQVGDGYVRRNKPEMALVHFNKAIELNGDNLDARVKRGSLLAAQGLDEQALAEFNKVLEKSPDHAIANEAAGCVYFRAGLYDEAKSHLNRAVALNPMLWKAHNFLGIIHDRNREYDQAAEEFSAALELHQGNGADEIYNNLGVVHIARKQYVEAVETFRRALQTGGVSARTYNNLGLALARMGRLDEALESFKYAGGEAKAHNNLGYVLLTENRPAQAVPYFEKAIELSPSYYVKAADNLKRARLAARFQDGVTQSSGSTPNPLLRKSFPDSKQNPGEPAASPASAGSPPPSAKVVKAALEEPGSADDSIIPHEKTYGLHVSSWRDHNHAFAQCEKLKKKGFSTWINQVDLGDKGIWYRVLVGEFGSIKEAQVERPDVLTILNLDRAPVYERVDPRPVVSAQL